jgi:hypothetical protein
MRAVAATSPGGHKHTLSPANVFVDQRGTTAPRAPGAWGWRAPRIATKRTRPLCRKPGDAKACRVRSSPERKKPFGCTSRGDSGRPNTDAPIAVDQKLVLVEWLPQTRNRTHHCVCFGRTTRQVTSGRFKRWRAEGQPRTLCRWVAKVASRKAPFVHTRAGEVGGVQGPKKLGGIFSTAPFISGFDSLKKVLSPILGRNYFRPISSLSSTAMKLKLKSVFGTGNTKGL